MDLMHHHREPETCDICQPWPDWARYLMVGIADLTNHITEIRELTMTEASNQIHLDQDVQALGASVAQIVTELKAQSASGQALDFTAADALVASVQGEATADAPAPAPAPAVPAPADPAAAAAAAAAGVAPAPNPGAGTGTTPVPDLGTTPVA